MKERPIIFSGPMVRAILDGRKTMTRRVVKPQPLNNRVGMVNGAYARLPNSWLVNGSVSEYHDKGITPPRWECPYGQPGDRLWVRETHYVQSAGYQDGTGKDIRYRADMVGDSWDYFRRRAFTWTPSIHMPRWASRITLEVTGVRVERLQDISEEDAIAEGIARDCCDEGWRNYRAKDPLYPTYGLSPKASFNTLWQSLNAKRPGCSWDDNPWVWVVEFQQVEATS